MEKYVYVDICVCVKYIFSIVKCQSEIITEIHISDKPYVSVYKFFLINILAMLKSHFVYY